MHDKPFPEELSQLLGEFAEAGGVVDFALFELPAGEAWSPARHQEALLSWAGKGATPRAARRARKILQSEKMKAVKITVPEFLGPFCSSDQRTLIFKLSCSSDEMKGFAYAFSDPPYGMDSKAAQKLFVSFLDLLFGPLADLDILEWNTTWAPYFDSGHDWWGSFCWTVYSPHRNHLVVIAASSTD